MGGTSSQVLTFHKEEPIGVKNGLNLEYQTTFEFDPETFDVFLSCLLLGPDSIEIVNGNTFRIKLDPNDPTKLNCPPLQNEPFRVSYIICK